MKLTRKSIGRIAASFVATAMLATMAIVPASAAEDYTPISGGSMTFDKYLVMSEDATVPTAEFTYTIAGGQDVSGTAVVGGEGTVADVTAEFAPTDTTYNTVQAGDTLTLDENEKYAVDVVTVDFSSVEFDAPGVYRYTVTESGTVDGVTNDATAIRYIDVYVIDNNGTLAIDGYVFHRSNAVADEDGNYVDENEKETGFTNSYATQNITLTKKVEGNQGDASKDFAFTIVITSEDGSTKSYVVDYSDSTREDGTMSSGATGATVYLSDEETVTIKGLSEGDKYTITETSYANEGYTTEYTIGDGEAVTGLSTGEKTTADGTNIVFTNTRSASTPTGIMMDIAPYAVLVVIAAAGCFIFLRKRHAKED